MNESASLPVYDSASRRFKAFEELRDAFHYRGLIYQLVRRDLVTRYKRSVLGVAWTMLNPLGTTLIMAIVFSQVFGRGPQYATYILSGLIAWSFFSQSSVGAMRGIVWGSSLLKRIYLPRTVFAISSIGTGLVNIALAIVPLLVVMLISHVTPTLYMLLLPIPVLILAMFALGIGLLLSTLATHFPDVAEMYGIVLTAWMYFSPIIWKPQMIPERFLGLIHLNPMFHIMTLFRALIYEGRIPTMTEIAIPGAIAVSSLLIGWLVFCSKVDELAYRV
ncbi:MAG: ABC transporter permease [Anaerolineales bacterium]|nr:ABC transporter permease [Anaerolineales bacterium]